MSLMRLHAQRNDCYPLSDDSVWSGRISFREVTVGVIILSETLLGALGNFPLLCHYLILNCNEAQRRDIDLILMHLALSNYLVIISKGVPQTMEAFRLKYFLGVFGCHLLLCVQRVSRSISIGITCLLSVFQAIMISPLNSYWKDLKAKAPQYVTVSVSLCWTFYIFVNVFFPMHTFDISSKWSIKNFTKNRYWGYCYASSDEKVSVPVYSALIIFPEVVFSVLIVWASGSMILFLHRHKQRVQHIHKNYVASRSIESRAIQKILLLVISFVCFHTLSFLFHMSLALVPNENEWLCNATSVISLCFPTVIPFLIMRCNSIVVRLPFPQRVIKKIHYHTPKSSKPMFWNYIQWLTQAYRLIQAYCSR